MIPLLLLCACFGTGFSDYDIKRYGDTYNLKVPRKAEALEFTPEYSRDVIVLWKRDDIPPIVESRRKVRGGVFVIYNLTQEDSGKYIMRDKIRLPQTINNLRVKEKEESYTLSPGESLRISYDLSPLSCYIYFVPENEDEEKDIVVQGRLSVNSYDINCYGFGLLKPCGVTNTNLQRSCSGRLEIRDDSGHKALVVSVQMEPDNSYEPSSIGIGLGISSCVLSCCICLKRCCCGKSSSKEDSAETPDAEPAVHYHEYDREPAGGRPEQVSSAAELQYPTQPFTTQTDPLIHSRPCLPPPYSEVSVPVEFKNTPAPLYDSNPAPTVLYDSNPAPTVLYDSNPAPTVLYDSNPAPTVLSDSNPEPQFELKGMSFATAPPMEHVYTSDKLNFL